MITLKLSNYDKMSKAMLFKILQSGLNFNIQTMCENHCENCRYKYVCEDVHKTLDFLMSSINSSKT